MKKFQLAGSARAMRIAGCASVFGLTMLGASMAHAAPVDVQVWYTLDDSNKAEFEKLVKQYNKEQSDVNVKVRSFANEDALVKEARATVAAKKTPPNLVQLDDDHSPEAVADRKAILPLYELLAKYPIKDLDWFLPATSSCVRDAKGRLLAFPFMAEVPVMFYNTTYYKKAGLNPDAPARTWQELQGQLLALRDKAEIDCPYATSDQVAVHLENLAPVNNQLYTSNNNGLDAGKVAPTLLFDTLYMRHISLMVSWKRSALFTQHTAGSEADSAFAKGTCAVLTTGSGALGSFVNAKGLSFGVAPLPYYEQATKSSGRPFVSGSAFWAIDGRPKDEEKATANFLAWLSKPVTAALWHQHTGFLPLTEAAYRAADVSFYSKIPGAQRLVTALRDKPVSGSRGFRMANYDRIEPVLNSELNEAFDAKTPPVAALNKASTAAHSIASQR